MILNIDDDGDNSDDSDTCQTDGSIEYGQNMQRLGSQQICSQCVTNHNVIKTMCQSLETSNAIISMQHPFLVKYGNAEKKYFLNWEIDSPNTLFGGWKSPSL